MHPGSIRRQSTEWAQLIAQYHASGEEEREFCQRHGLVVSTFRKWKYRYSPRSTISSPTSTSTPSNFIELTPARASTNETVRLQLDKGLTIECPLSMGTDAIAQLIQAVSNGR